MSEFGVCVSFSGTARTIGTDSVPRASNKDVQKHTRVGLMTQTPCPVNLPISAGPASDLGTFDRTRAGPPPNHFADPPHGLQEAASKWLNRIFVR
jgi:hypothetical protein